MKNDDIDNAIGDRHVLIAVDDSKNAERAVLYAAHFLGGVPGFRATMITVIPEPPEDYFSNDEERQAWLTDHISEAEKMLDRYREVLIQSGFSNNKVDMIVDVRDCPSIADCIIDMQQRLECCTVIVGRRGISKKEEFLFGSTSSKVVHSGKNCAVWVIE
jgi:nucleotide-binding universal stress UspA family protein